MIHNIGVIFMSIFFESLPFLLLGAFLGSLIEHFVTDEMIEKLIPKNKILSSLVGVVLGFFLPACDCAVIPITKELMRKKIPINVCVSFMLSSPIINPVVLLSTYYAFRNSDPSIIYLRLILGIIISFIIGLIISLIFNGNVVKEEDICDCHEHQKPKSTKGIILSIIKHTAIDTYDVVKYLIFGALIASLVQVVLPRDIITMFRNNNILSIITMMLFAYLISLCSTSDSFIGKSLLSTFTKESVLAYLLLGPMIDIKNTVVLLGNFKSKFVITLISLIFIFIFLLTLLGGKLI